MRKAALSLLWILAKPLVRSITRTLLRLRRVSTDVIIEGGLMPGPIVDIGFCGADDHMLIGIGHGRFGVYDYLYPLQGVFGRFELWATEEEILKFLNDAIDGVTTPEGSRLTTTITGARGKWILDMLRSNAFGRWTFENKVLAHVYEFRNRPGVLEQTSQWKQIRTGDGDVTDITPPPPALGFGGAIQVMVISDGSRR